MFVILLLLALLYMRFIRPYILFLFILAGPSGFAQQMEAFYDVKEFYLPGDNPYIDVFVSILGRSVEYGSGGTAEVESILIIKSGKHIVDFRKTLIEGPENGIETKKDFIDAQRFALKNGKYTLEIYLHDLKAKNADTLKVVHPFELFYNGGKVLVSDIELVESYEKKDPDTPPNLYTKAGYQLKPFVSNYYPENYNTISFYAEIYNTDIKIGEDKKYVAIAQITDEGYNVIDNYRLMIVQKGKPVNVILNSFNIEKLYSGTYLLDIEVRNAKNEVLTHKSLRFFRNNVPPIDVYTHAEPVEGNNVLFTELITDRDTLTEYIKSLRPRADFLERTLIDKQINRASTEELQQFLYTFWEKRNKENPQLAWDEYRDLVEEVNEMYGTKIKKGYETDRGRVYLQYGKPDQLVDVPSEPNAYPYQIWYYYHIGNYNNRKFVFYSRDLASNDYTLLHSDMVGEFYNNQWDVELHSRTVPINNVDQQTGIPNTGSRALDYYTNPR